MKDFRDLQVWHKAHALTLHLYQHTKGFPKEEIFASPVKYDGQQVQLARILRKGAVKKGILD